MRTKAPLDVRFGLILKQKLSSGTPMASIRQLWNADANGTVSVEDFRKYPLQLKSMGEFHSTGTQEELKEQLNKVLQRPLQRSFRWDFG